MAVRPGTPAALFFVLAGTILDPTTSPYIAVAPLPNQVPYTGRIELDSLRELLVARNLAFTAASRLRRKSQLAIAPHIADLFIF